MQTLQQLVDQAFDQAVQDAEPFLPSHAQIATRLQPVVNQILAMNRIDAWQMFSHMRIGTWDLHVLAEFKSALSLEGLNCYLIETVSTSKATGIPVPGSFRTTADAILLHLESLKARASAGELSAWRITNQATGKAIHYWPRKQ